MADEVASTISNSVEETVGKQLSKEFKDNVIDGIEVEKYADDIADQATKKGRKLTWDEVKALFKRGNDFNTKATDNAWYFAHEVVVEHPTLKYLDGPNKGKPKRFRLDSCNPNDLIVSRIATITFKNTNLKVNHTDNVWDIDNVKYICFWYEQKVLGLYPADKVPQERKLKILQNLSTPFKLGIDYTATDYRAGKCDNPANAGFLVNYSQQAVPNSERLRKLLAGKSAVHDVEKGNYRHQTALRVFLSDGKTSPSQLEDIKGQIAKCPITEHTLWLHHDGSTWTLKDVSSGNGSGEPEHLGDFNAALANAKLPQISLNGLLTTLQSVNGAGFDAVLTGLYEGFDALSKGIDQFKIPEYAWNCNKEGYNPMYAEVYGYLTAPVKPLREMIAKGINLVSPTSTVKIEQIEFAALCGVWNGLIGTFSGVAGALAQIAEIQTPKGEQAFVAKLQEIANYNPNKCLPTASNCEQGMWLYAKDTAGQFGAELGKPCVAAEMGGEIGFGIFAAVATGGAAAAAQLSGKLGWFLKALKWADKANEVLDIGGKLFGAVAKIAGQPLTFAYRNGKAYFKGLKKLDFNRQTPIGDYLVHSNQDIPKNAQIKPLLDEDGNLVLNQDGDMGIGCAFTPNMGYNPNPTHLSEPVLYASLNATPNFSVKILTFVAATGGCPNGQVEVGLSRRVLKTIKEVVDDIVAKRSYIRDNIMTLQETKDLAQAYFNKIGGTGNFDDWYENTFKKYESGTPNFEAHHIIPINVLETNDKLKELMAWAINEGKDFNFNNIENGMMIQKKSINLGIDGHGKHKDYNDAISEKITALIGDANGDNAVAFAKIKTLISNTKQKLKIEVLLGDKNVNDIVNF